eukprot:Transcript_20528.p1 GENE.Transcript_20528~~Transcript_20528.p1  ORF type:complete len:469 (-),score=202.01 Transcript_20528:288-1694(-)
MGRLFGGEKAFGSLKELDAEAAALPVGAEGVSVLETFQGSRTPVTDPLARGALLGLTLHHTRAHVWRATLEAVCLGTKASLLALAAATGAPPALLLMAGGATRSPFFTQMHADATGVPVEVGECANAPLLGAAVLAAALPGSLHGGGTDGGAADGGAAATLAVAVGAMVRAAKTVAPQAEAAAAYDELYRRGYASVAPTLAPLSHRLARGAAAGARAAARRAAGGAPARLRSGREALVMPSLLSADAANYGAAARDIAAAGATWAHIDVFDGTEVVNGALSSMGPSTITALRAALPELRFDVHLGVSNPAGPVEQMLGALRGAGRITLQWEAFAAAPRPAEAAAALCRRIGEAGCAAGMCVAPKTPVEVLTPLLDAGLIDLVDILAVECGWGGQPFQPGALDKVRWVRTHYPQLPYIQVDGGIKGGPETAAAAAAGANVLVAGSYLFGADDLPASFDGLEEAILAHGL